MMQVRFLLGIMFSATIVAIGMSRPAVAQPNDGRRQSVDYTRQIKPILAARCFACHGVLKQESQLRLDAGTFIRKGGESGPVVVAGQAVKSALIKRVTAAEESERMPPEGDPLTADQIALLKAWIDQGATSPADEQPEEDPRKHWSFQVPVRPQMPQVKNAAWVDNPIDAFVAVQHQRRGLQPVGSATKAVLLRRVYLDLIGLPPTRKQLHAFLENTSNNAYAELVDELLESPHHGERWGRHWMDVWRYSDWYGRRAVNDVRNSYPHIWRWRDWIVQSLNADKGYDRMIQEMLAADEIAPEDDAAIAATGFIVRNWFSLNYDQWMKDLVEHTGKAFLGIRMNCAHCHDHKYDPITQEEYFKFRAFFEPLEFRHDRVPGGPDLPKYKRYTPGSGSSLKPIAAGLPRIFDENLEAKTFMYRMGDARDRFDRHPVTAGGPAILGGDKLKIETFELPAQAWYPGLKPFVAQAEIAKRENAVKAAEAVLAKSKQVKFPEPTALIAAIKQATKRLAEVKLEVEQAENVQSKTAAARTTEKPKSLIGYWRFEGADNDAGFLADSSGKGHTLKRVTGKDPAAKPFLLSESGMGRAFFSPIPVDESDNQQSALFSQQRSFAYLAADGKPDLYANQFTIEAYTHFRVSAKNFNRTIADYEGCWTLLHRGLNGTTSEFRLRYFNEKGDVRDIATGNAATPLTLTTGHDFAIAVTLGEKTVTFYARDLTDDGPLQTLTVDRNDGDKDFSTLARPDAKTRFKIGNSDGTGRHDGLIDEVRYSSIAAAPSTIAARTKTSPLHAKLNVAKQALALAKAKLAAAAPAASAPQVQLDGALAQLKAFQARLAADRAKYQGGPGDSDDLAKIAYRAEKLAASASAKATLVKARTALADAQAKAAIDKKAKADVTKAQKQVAAAKKVVAAADKNLTTADTTSYTPLGPKYPNKSTGRRRALAAWIANSKNPLTARVAVNHIWMRHFGQPLVASVFDFGRSGQKPSHPGLLDWLAVEFMESGWSMKHIHRLIVNSNTYRMRSAAAESDRPNINIDADNRYLWRREPRRMEAEVIRDSVLHAAGQLDLTLGGQDLDNKLENTSRRRSLYFSIYPEAGGGMKFTTLFDAPDPGDCYRRTESIVPQQALAMANSGLSLSQSRLLATKIWNEINKSTSDDAANDVAFVTAAFEYVLSRTPTGAETKLCIEFLQKQVQLLRSADPKRLKVQTPKGIAAPAADAELRAKQSLIHALFNHNDFVTIR